MRAAMWEYRLRLWILVGLFGVAFAMRRGPRFADGVRGVLDVSDEAALRATLLLAAITCAIGAWLRVWGTAYLTSDVVQDGALRTDALVADGPYRRVRNPLYLGTIALGAGLGMLGTIAGGCVLVVGLVLFVLRLIGHEERALVAAQDRDYFAYCRAVPRLWPSLRPRLPSSARKPDWRQALVGESFVVACAIACALGAAVGSVVVTERVIAVAFPAWVALRVAIRARVHARVSPPRDP